MEAGHERGHHLSCRRGHRRPYFSGTCRCRSHERQGLSNLSVTDKRGAALLADIEKLPVRLHVISAASPFQSGIFRRIIALTKLGMGALFCLWHIGLRPPMVMIGFGGYPSFAPLLVARLFGVPVMVHEQNAYLGRANHALAARARLIALSWPQTKNLPE